MIDRKYFALCTVLLALMLFIAACGNDDDPSNNETAPAGEHMEENGTSDSESDNTQTEAVITDPVTAAPETPEPEDVKVEDVDAGKEEAPEQGSDAIQVVAEPEAITVLVNKLNALPEGYEPTDLTEPDVPFIFSEKSDKRKMRKEAAEALELLFAGAKEDGIGLAGVSGYRSYATQKALFQRYVNRDGLEAASRYSARPGHSEHSTGLAMDVTGSDGKCAATDCFGGTPAAIWLDEHAHEYGFIIRYPNGKEDITGYKYEPWHLRYVGIELAAELKDSGLTMEEYYNDAVPVVS